MGARATQLASLNAKKLQVYSELLPSDYASHAINKGAPSHTSEEILATCICDYVPSLKFTTIGESGSGDWPIN